MRGRLIVALALLAGAPAASAHVTLPSGPYRVTVGWAVEPAYSGVPNDVQVRLSPAARLVDGVAQVRVGGAQVTLPLVPAGAPGSYGAQIVPTRPGTYTFRVGGTVRGRAIEVRATCSQRTFDCVAPVSAVQFPAQDPPSGVLLERLAREQRRVKDASDRADTAQGLAIGALALAAAGAALALWTRRKRG